MNSKSQNYDLIFSLGEACSCSQSLRNSKLQVYSYPFDWLFGADFETRINILTSKFSHFIDKEDLENFYSERSIKCTAYKNKQNNLVFNHDFLENIDFNTMYEDVKEKYARRILRLLSKIENANNILLVYTETPNNENKLIDNNILITALNKVSSSFGENKNFKLLYFSNSLDFEYLKYQEDIISDNIIKIIGNYKSVNPQEPDYQVNFDFFKNYYKNYSLNLPFGYKLKKILLKNIINLIPIKKTRKNLRKKYHV